MTSAERDLIILDQKVIALHARLDRNEIETKEKLKDISEDIKKILDYQSRSRGRDAAFATIGTIFGGAIVGLIKLFLN